MAEAPILEFGGGLNSSVSDLFHVWLRYRIETLAAEFPVRMDHEIGVDAPLAQPQPEEVIKDAWFYKDPQGARSRQATQNVSAAEIIRSLVLLQIRKVASEQSIVGFSIDIGSPNDALNFTQELVR